MISTEPWAKLVGTKPVKVRFDMPSHIGGIVNAGYLSNGPGGKPDPIIGLTPALMLLQGHDPDAVEAIVAHEYGHAIQEQVKPDGAMEAKSRRYEEEADAISGILLQRPDGAKRSFSRIHLLLRFGGFENVDPHPEVHADEAERVALINKWAMWSQGKSDAERREKILGIARGDITP